jgi:hypothetical protein
MLVEIYNKNYKLRDEESQPADLEESKEDSSEPPSEMN